MSEANQSRRETSYRINGYLTVEDKIIHQSMLLIRAPSCVAARTWRGIIALGVCRKRAKRGEGPAGATPLRGVLIRGKI